ncbi:MAG: cell division protein ZipA [Verrucomicrobiaceae bacterium]|nr:cell division protein ZipA [Verrucomicrobiaceae bacterium]
MEFSVREWTIVVGVLLIVAVFLDGYRRVRNERSNRIRVSLSKQVFNQPQSPLNEVVDESNPELPAGGVRVIAKRRNEDLKLHQSVPVMIEPVAIAPAPQPEPVVEEPEPEIIETIDESLYIEDAEEIVEVAPIETVQGREENHRAEPKHDIESKESLHKAVKVSAPESPAARIKSAFNAFKREEKHGQQPVELEPVKAQEVLVVNVLCKDKDGFKGPDLLQLLLACDLRFGKLDIFHRYEKANGKGPVQFSVANLVEPGGFDLDAIDNFSTPGVCFFLTLPGPEKPVTAFNYMVETAQVLVRHLHAELRDDAQSVMTAQTIEHCRQRIRDFERKQLTLQL